MCNKHIESALRRDKIISKRAERRNTNAAMRNFDVEAAFAEDKEISSKMMPSEKFISKVRSYHMCISYTRNDKPCGEWIGLDSHGNLCYEYAFGLTPCNSSYEYAEYCTIKNLCNDNPDILDNVLNHEYKTNPYFLYWTCSGTFLCECKHRKDSIWLGDYLVSNKINRTIKCGVACELMTQGLTVKYVLKHIEELVQESRETWGLLSELGMTHTESAERRRWFKNMVHTHELGFVYDMARTYRWLSKYSFADKLHAYRIVHEELDFSQSLCWSEDSPVNLNHVEEQKAVDVFRHFSGACEEGTRLYLQNHEYCKMLSNLGEYDLMFLISKYGAENVYHYLQLGESDYLQGFGDMIMRFLKSFK